MPPKKPLLTHFLCLPVASNSATQWQESLQQFTTNVQSLQTQNSLSPSTSATTLPPTTASHIPVRAIRPLGTLHLTLGVMSLTEPEKVEAATALLRSLDITSMLTAAEQKHSKDIAGAEAVQSEAGQHNPSLGDSRTEPDETSQRPSFRPLILSFTGLKSMHSPKSTSFLYTPPTDRTDRLYPFCHAIIDRFAQGGFMIEDKRALKLHATILNTIYAGKVSSSRKPKDDHLGNTKAKGAGSAGVADNNVGSYQEHHDEGHPDGGPEEQDLPAEEDEHTKPTGRPPDPKGKKGRRKKEVIRFNARELLARYADFEWARDVRIEKLAICEMGAKKIMDEEGEVVGEKYTEIASVLLP